MPIRQDSIFADDQQAARLRLRCLFVEELPADVALRASSSKPVLEIENVSFQYPRCKNLLENITLSVGVGEVLGVVGHNGAGKSTLMELICGLRREKGGVFRINGKNASAKQRIRATYLVIKARLPAVYRERGEDSSLVTQMTPCSRQSRELMRLLDLANYRERHPASLSGGRAARCQCVAFMKNARLFALTSRPAG